MLGMKMDRPIAHSGTSAKKCDIGTLPKRENMSLLSSGGRVPALDGLRAISALMLTLGHSVLAFNSPLPRWSSINARFLGGSAVDLFFVISGFLITLLLLREKDRTGRISLGQFYARRALRILPAYAAFLAVLFVFAAWKMANLAPNVWLQLLTYTVNCHPQRPEWVIGHIWSLCVEEHFYLIWPILLVVLGARLAPFALIGCFLGAPVLRYFLWTYGPDFLDIDQFTLTRMDTIAMGCFLAFFVHSERSVRFARLLKGCTNYGVVVAGALLVLSIFFVNSGKYDLFVKRSVEAGLMAFIIFACVSNPKGIWTRVLDSPPLVMVGVLSYSLYIWQPFLTPPADHWPDSWIFNIGAFVAAAVISYLIVERPFLKLKARVSKENRRGLELRIVHAEPQAQTA